MLDGAWCRVRRQSVPAMPAGGSGGGSRWGNWCGLVCLPGGTPFPPCASPPSSFVVVRAQFTLGRFAPYRLFSAVPSSVADPAVDALQGRGLLLSERATRPAGDCARRLASPSLAWLAGALARPELASLAGWVSGAVRARGSPVVIRAFERTEASLATQAPWPRSVGVTNRATAYAPSAVTH